MQELYPLQKAHSTEVMQMISQEETDTIRIFKLPKMGERCSFNAVSAVALTSSYE